MLGWSDIGISHQHNGFYQNGRYTPADIYENYKGELIGLHLVLDQRANRSELPEWHLHQDLVVTLGLKREGDTWVSPDEGYVEVAHLRKESGGKPVLLEVRADHLKDYLCARNMGLYITSYHSRIAIVDNISFITWEGGSLTHEKEQESWEGRIIKIHEGGLPYGGKMAVFHVSRTDIDETDDIPDITASPTDENTKSNSWELEFEGRILYRILGELWRNEWVEPAHISPRVRRDNPPPSVFFVVDEQGNLENKETLALEGKWLWFKPDVVMALAHRRGGGLNWHTRDTGSIGCSPDYYVHFGINTLGLLNVYAKDVATLPEWQQRIWAGYNVGPEGGVSEELLASQVRAEPAETQAPEELLKHGMGVVNQMSKEIFNISLFRDHDIVPQLFERTHRFRAIDDAGLYALAKDVARLTVDNLDTAAIQSIVPPPPKTKWGSLKSLENLLAIKIGSGKARSITSALVGAYELRHADAHLPGEDIDKAFELLKIDRGLPTVLQGYQLLQSCVSSIYDVIDILKEW
jgi:hypothetical protein